MTIILYRHLIWAVSQHSQLCVTSLTINRHYWQTWHLEFSWVWNFVMLMRFYINKGYTHAHHFNCHLLHKVGVSQLRQPWVSVSIHPYPEHPHRTGRNFISMWKFWLLFAHLHWPPSKVVLKQKILCLAALPVMQPTVSKHWMHIALKSKMWWFFI